MDTTDPMNQFSFIVEASKRGGWAFWKHFFRLRKVVSQLDQVRVPIQNQNDLLNAELEIKTLRLRELERDNNELKVLNLGLRKSNSKLVEWIKTTHPTDSKTDGLRALFTLGKRILLPLLFIWFSFNAVAAPPLPIVRNPVTTNSFTNGIAGQVLTWFTPSVLGWSTPTGGPGGSGDTNAFYLLLKITNSLPNGFRVIADDRLMRLLTNGSDIIITNLSGTAAFASSNQFQPANANLSNWANLDTNVLSAIGALVWTNDGVFTYLVNVTNAIHLDSLNGGITVGTNTARLWGGIPGSSGEALVSYGSLTNGEFNNREIFIGLKGAAPTNFYWDFFVNSSQAGIDGTFIDGALTNTLEIRDGGEQLFQFARSGVPIVRLNPTIVPTDDAVAYLFDATNALLSATNALAFRTEGTNRFVVAGDAIFPNDATQYFDGTGHWSTPAGGGTGTVTSVGLAEITSGAALFEITGSPVTTSGILSLNLTNANLTNWAKLPTNAFPTTAYVDAADLTKQAGSGTLTNLAATGALTNITSANSILTSLLQASNPAPIVKTLSGSANITITDQTTNLQVAATGLGSGTVTSVALSSADALFAVSGSPITSSGTMGLTLTNSFLTNWAKLPTNSFATASGSMRTNQVWVDKLGSDSTGTLNDFNKPFLTVTGAVTAVSNANPLLVGGFNINIGVGNFTNDVPILVPTNSALIGVNNFLTRLYSTNRISATEGACVTLSDDCLVKDLRIIALRTNVTAAPIGKANSVHKRFNRARIENVITEGISDGFFCTGGTGCSADSINCDFISGDQFLTGASTSSNGWDCVAWDGSSAHRFRFFNCRLQSYGSPLLDASAGGEARAVNANEGKGEFYTCLITVTNGATNTVGIKIRTASTIVELYNTPIFASSIAGTVYTIMNTNDTPGTCTVYGGILDSNQFNGPVTLANWLTYSVAGTAVAQPTNVNWTIGVTNSVSGMTLNLGIDGSGTGRVALTNAPTINGATLSGNVTNSGGTASRFISLDANKQFAYSAASSVMAASISDETGTGLLVFNKNPQMDGTYLTNDLHLSGVITPGVISADQNDYNPTGLSTAGVVELRGDGTTRTITGLQSAASEARLVILRNVTNSLIVLANESSSSQATNRFALPEDFPLIGFTEIHLNYSSTSNRWYRNGPSTTLAGSQFRNQGASTQVLHGNASGNPSWSAVADADLSSSVLKNISTTKAITNFTRTIITATGVSTYTVPSGVKYIFVECVGGGAGGGAVDGSASQSAAGGGGGSGAYCSTNITSPAASYVVTVGAGGGGGATPSNNGTNGGNTLFTNLMTAPGGTGGSGKVSANAVSVTLGGAGGAVATGGTVNSGGTSGGNGICVSGALAISGEGAASIYGGGGAAQTAAVGGAATGFGAGGGGAAVISNTDRAGGNGANGVIIVWEFYQ